MLSLFSLWFGALVRLFRHRGSVVLENLVLRQQLTVLKRRDPRPSLSLPPQRQRPRPEFQSQPLRRPQANFATLDGVQRLQQPENLVYPEPCTLSRFRPRDSVVNSLANHK
jgi:hypothetical protein